MQTTDLLRRILGGRRSLRRRVSWLAGVGGLLLVLQVASQLVAGPWAIVSGSRARDLTGLAGTASDLRASAEEEWSELLLYFETGVPEFLAAAQDRRRDADRQLRELDRGLAGTRIARDVSRASADFEEWGGWTEVARVRTAEETDSLTVDDLVEGDQLFERVLDSFRTLEGAVLAAQVDAGLEARRAGSIAIVLSVAGSIGVGVVVLLLAIRIIRLGVVPLVRLAATAQRIARGEPAVIQADGSDEIRQLAGALGAWQEAAAERELVAQQAPVGILRVDTTGSVVSVNRAVERMHQASADELVGRPLADLVHAADRALAADVMQDVRDGSLTSAAIEARGLRRDGTSVWLSVTVGRLLTAEGLPAGTVGILEDITERKRQAERAARIQRELWPQAPPVLPGYEVAGACLPAQVVAGDLYDWMVTPDGQLELTLADVMGKGIGAAMIMATLRAALRSAPPGLGPASKLALAAKSMTLDRDDDGTFVTVFHARLDPRTGHLRYVDAGHGYSVIRRADGELVSLDERSLPVGVMGGEAFSEGSAMLEPGDTLVVYSDGLVETGDEAGLDQRAVGEALADAEDAEDVVRRLLGRMPGRPMDDVTALAVRRLPLAPTARAVA